MKFTISPGNSRLHLQLTEEEKAELNSLETLEEKTKAAQDWLQTLLYNCELQ